jgi:hypothetical protein
VCFTAYFASLAPVFSPGVSLLKAINIENKEFEQVKSFKYLGSTVNTDNTIDEEIK